MENVEYVKVETVKVPFESSAKEVLALLNQAANEREKVLILSNLISMAMKS